MSEVHHFHAIANMIALALSGLFAVASLAHLFAPTALREAYARAGYARSFLYVMSIALGLAVIFLAVPQMRVWGGILGGLILFTASTAFLYRERYAYAIPAILLLAALAPAMA